jgi:hypothetical protein
MTRVPQHYAPSPRVMPKPGHSSGHEPMDPSTGDPAEAPSVPVTLAAVPPPTPGALPSPKQVVPRRPIVSNRGRTGETSASNVTPLQLPDVTAADRNHMPTAPWTLRPFRPADPMTACRLQYWGPENPVKSDFAKSLIRRDFGQWTRMVQ